MKKILLLILSLFITIIVTYAQPANDDCSGLIDIGEAPVCPDDIFTNIDATASDIGFGNIPTCFNSGILQNDVWFSFSVPADITEFIISVVAASDGSNGPMSNPQIALYRGECLFNGLAEVGCASSADGASGTFLSAEELTPGSVYFLRINDYSSSAAPNWGDFRICIEQLSGVTASASDDAICFGESVQLSVNGFSADEFSWSPSASLNDPTLPNPVANPNVTTTFTVNATSQFGSNLIQNGDFEQGDILFTSDYIFPEVPGQWGLLDNEGTYGIGTNPTAFHSNFHSCGDHTSGNGNMMVVNGSTSLNENVWCQTVAVEPGTTYRFSTWLTSVEIANPAILQFSIDGTLIGALFNAPFTSCTWTQFFEIWNSGENNSVEICIVNQNIAQGGNDFALDDISLIPIIQSSDTVTVTVSNPVATITNQINAQCTGVCNGQATVEVSGGLEPYTYLWPVEAGAQTTPTATELCGGSYEVRVTDSEGCTATATVDISEEAFSLGVIPTTIPCEVSESGQAQAIPIGGTGPYTFSWDNGESGAQALNMTAGPHTVTVTDVNGCNASGSIEIELFTEAFTVQANPSDTVICKGQSLSLNAEGENIASVEWSPAEAFSDPGSMNPFVTPSQTTTYTVTAYSYGQESIINGDFEAGHIGFESDYEIGTGGSYGILSNEGQYEITTNPALVHNNFANCADHTSGTGNMLVVNGAENPNVNIWCQTINVVPNTDYQFSAWLMSVISQNPAELQFSINGQLIGEVFNASPTLCEWLQFAETWPSGGNVEATICIVNQNVSGDGNDFALDDISFIPVCQSEDSVTVTVSDPQAFITLVSDSDCDGLNGSAEIAGEGGVAPYSFLWDNGETTAIAMSLSLGAHSATITDIAGCEASSQIEIGGGSLLAFDEIEATNTSCGEDNGIITVNAINGVDPLVFSLDNGPEQDENTFPDLPADEYLITVIDGNACTIDTLITIEDSEPLIPVIESTTTELCTDSLILEVEEQDYSYIWSNGAQGYRTIIYEPGIYTVSVTDTQGCTGSAEIEITECEEWFVPNAFTPNGDGFNDIFRVKNLDAVKLFQVYSRWGQLVFESKNNQGWDGRHEGTFAPSDVYIYYIILNVNGEEIVEKGDVTLIR